MGDKALASVGFAFDPITALGTGSMSGAFDGPKGPRLPEETDEEEAEAKKKERDRINRGRSDTRLSGSLSQALNASIGKRTLGGAV